MSPRYRDFDAEYQASKADADKEPITFKLGGQEWTAIPEAPAGLLMDVITSSAVLGDVEEGSPESMAAIGSAGAAAYTFLMGVLIDDDKPRFVAAMHSTDPSKLITLNQWRNTLNWLAGEYMAGDGDRPTMPPPASPGWRSQNGAGSTAISPAGV
jgi:hypothetical protein